MSRLRNKRAPTQRQLRVGEELRHAISDVLRRGETHDPALESISITVSEVRISPDLKNATAYVTPLAGGEEAESVVELLNHAAPNIRKVMNKKVVLKYSPKIYFKLDRSFDEANRVNELLNRPEVARDVGGHDHDGDQEVVN